MNSPIERIHENGNQIWKFNGGFHREDGPAIILADGTQQWWVNNNRHRLDGPAYIGEDGRQSWWVNDKRHRLDGPAIIGVNGNQWWWVNGNKITNEYDLSLFDSEEGRMILAIKYGRPI